MDMIKTIEKKIIFLQILLFIVVAVLLLFIYFHPISFAQNSKEKLKKDKEKIENDIAYTNQLLAETKKTTLISLNQLIILNNKIGEREELIDAISGEIEGLDNSINSKKELIDKLSLDLQDIKTEYARLIYQSFRSGNSYDRIVFLFSADDFNQAYFRMKYLQQYSEYRKKQAAMIISTQELMSENLTNLAETKSGKIKLLNNKEKEKENLTQEKNEKNNSIKKLKLKEKELTARLKEKEKASKKLKKAVENIIAIEVSKAPEKAKKSGTTITKTNINLTSEELVLSNTFEKSKGMLPWPLEKGIITGRFGEHPHPVLQNIKVKNNGIDISTNSGANARCVYSGKVTGIVNIPGSNKAIIIRHGDYLTVYSNLSAVFVKSGEKVSAKQNIGTIFTNADETKTELHFEIWYGKTILNPSDWLGKK